MGGIMAYMYINDNKLLKFDILLEKKEGVWKIVSSGYSYEFDMLLKERKN